MLIGLPIVLVEISDLVEKFAASNGGFLALHKLDLVENYDLMEDFLTTTFMLSVLYCVF